MLGKVIITRVPDELSQKSKHAGDLVYRALHLYATADSQIYHDLGLVGKASALRAMADELRVVDLDKMVMERLPGFDASKHANLGEAMGAAIAWGSAQDHIDSFNMALAAIAGRQADCVKGRDALDRFKDGIEKARKAAEDLQHFREGSE